MNRNRKGTTPSDIADCLSGLCLAVQISLRNVICTIFQKNPLNICGVLKGLLAQGGMFVYHHCLETTFLFLSRACFPITDDNSQTKSSGCGGVFSFTRKLFSHTKQVSWLTDRRSISPSHAIRSGTQWIHEISLPVYSDRIAQASHLIPSSDLLMSALDVAIFNYTKGLYHKNCGTSIYF